MASRFSSPITGDYRLLFRIPKSAIVSYLINYAEPESLKRAFHRGSPRNTAFSGANPVNWYGQDIFQKHLLGSDREYNGNGVE